MGLVAVVVLFLATAANAQTNAWSDAEIQGRQLAQQLCDSRPIGNFTNSGVLQIRDGNGNHTNYPIKCIISIKDTNWFNLYDSTLKPEPEHPVINYNLTIIHSAGQPNDYIFYSDGGLGTRLSYNEMVWPFRNSDFWLCDLGLEFFHWPAQKVLPKPTNLVRGREFTLLESTNPDPSTNGYSRVLSWVDKETGGILQAEAYDANGKLLKEFAPKSFKKVNGQWELQEMDIRNVQTGSRTRLEFDFKK